MHAQSLSHVPLFETPWTVTRQAPLPLEFSRQGYWNGLPFPTPGDLLHPGMEPASPASPRSAGGFFTTSTTWEALKHLKKDSMGSSNRPWCSEGVCVPPPHPVPQSPALIWQQGGSACAQKLEDLSSNHHLMHTS